MFGSIHGHIQKVTSPNLQLNAWMQKTFQHDCNDQGKSFTWRVVQLCQVWMYIK